MFLNISQDDFIDRISEQTNVPKNFIKKILESMENIVYDSLSTVTPEESVDIKLFKGLHVSGKYIPEHYVTRGVFKDVKCEARIKIKASFTDHYKSKFNLKKEN